MTRPGRTGSRPPGLRAPGPGRARQRRRAFAVIAGGGTGGHVVPALAIGGALVARGHEAGSIHFVGSARGVERHMVPAAGFPLTVLPGRGIIRRLDPSAMVANAAAAAGIVAAIGQAVVLLGRLRPSVVVVVGGYASVPCAVAGVLWRVPIVVAEQNAVPGAANRLASRVAAASAVSFAGTPLPRSVVTGNPVRAEVLAVDRSPEGRAAARRALNLPDPATVVAVATGSLGARRVNLAVVDLASRWSDRGGVAIRHVVGERDWAALGGKGPQSGPLTYQQVRFEDRMDLVYGAADVAVCRAGASTVAELAAVGLPAILVPLPGAPGDHQTANARALTDAGAAVVVADSECDGARLGAELDALVADPTRLAAMADAARTLARPRAADAVAALVEEHARG